MSKFEEHEEGEEGEAWLMSYADLISLLLAVFVLLFSLSTIDPPKAQIAAKAISTYLNEKRVDGSPAGDISLVDRQLMAMRLLSQFLDLGNPDKVLEKLMKMQDQPEELKKLQALAERMGLTGNAKLRSNISRYEIVLPEKLIFAKGSVELTSASAAVFKKITPRIIDALKDERRSIVIIGHTDPSDVSKDFSSTHIQSAAQAEAISLALQTYGVSPQRITVVGKGGTEPLFQSNGQNPVENARLAAKNRRVVLAIDTEASSEAVP